MLVMERLDSDLDIINTGIVPRMKIHEILKR
jgi:hypothetical protein